MRDYLPPHRIIFLSLFSLLLLAGCGRQSLTKPGQAADLIDLSTAPGYSFQGKMSFSDGNNGGSGQVLWQEADGQVSARLKAPLGGKSWQISESDNGSKLQTAEGVVIYGESSQMLISEQLGWQVPWNQLVDWVIGRVSDHKQGDLMWADDGYVIVEGGWQIKYSKLKNYSEGVLPHKMIARKGGYSIKLVIRKWNW